MIRKREIESIVLQRAQEYPAVAITGPRQSGKTTLARKLFDDRPYVSLEAPDTREFAQSDPRGFLAQYPNGAVLDEVQRCPELFSYLQEILDDSPRIGRFILTGSQQFHLLSRITQSLAGRVSILELLPFSLAEAYGGKPPSLENMLYQGLYPPVHNSKVSPSVWYDDYISTYIEHDVRELNRVQNLTLYRRFVEFCADRIGSLVNLADLARDVGVNRNTIRSWLSVLEASYIIFFLRPYHANFTKRQIKMHKLYFYDTGLAAAILSLTKPSQIQACSARGLLFENWVIAELMKASYNQGVRPKNFYFWLDHSKREVDLVIKKGTEYAAIEITAGLTLRADKLKMLNYWREKQGGDSWLVYGGDEARRQKGTRIIGWKRVREIGEDAGQVL